MHELPEPPPITIRDPSRPAQHLDFLGNADDAAWRPGRRLRVLAAVLVALLATAGLGLQHVRAASQDAALDRAALRELAVVLSAAVQDAAQSRPTDVPLVLRNEGPDPITVVTVRLDQPGYATQAVQAPLAPAQNVTVVVTGTPVCGATVPDAGPQRVLVVVRDYRGGRRELTLSTAPEMLDQQVLLRVRKACGLLPLQESVQLGALGTRRHADVVELDAALRDGGVLPAAIVGVEPDPGLHVATDPALPLRLRPASRTGADTVPLEQPLSLQLRVTDCGAVARRPLLGQAGRQVVLRLRGADGGTASTSLLPGHEFDRLLDRLEQETCKLSPHGL